MDLIDEVITHSGRFIELTLSTLTAFLDAMDKYASVRLSHHTEKETARKANEKLDKLVAYAEESDNHKIFLYSTTDFSLNEIKSVVPENVLCHIAEVEKPETKEKSVTILMRDKDRDIFANAVLGLAAQKCKLTRVPPHELCKQLGDNSKVLSIKGLNEQQLSYLQEVSKMNHRSFSFSAIKDETSGLYSVCSSAKNHGLISLALLDMKLRENSVEGYVTPTGEKLEIKEKMITEALKLQNEPRPFKIVSSSDLSNQISFLTPSPGENKASRSFQTTFDDKQMTFTEDFLGSERYLNELVYALRGLEKPVIVFDDELTNNSLESVASQKRDANYNINFTDKSLKFSADVQNREIKHLRDFVNEKITTGSPEDCLKIYNSFISGELIKDFVEASGDRFQRDPREIECFNEWINNTRDTISTTPCEINAFNESPLRAFTDIQDKIDSFPDFKDSKGIETREI